MGTVHAGGLCIAVFRRHDRWDIYLSIDIGLIGAIIIGFFAGALGLLVGQHIFSAARSPTIRLIVGLLFAVPAAYAGYSSTFSIAQVSIASEWSRQAFALVGAVVVGSTAWARLAMRAIPATALSPVHRGCRWGRP